MACGNLGVQTKHNSCAYLFVGPNGGTFVCVTAGSLVMGLYGVRNASEHDPKEAEIRSRAQEVSAELYSTVCYHTVTIGRITESLSIASLAISSTSTTWFTRLIAEPEY